MMPVVQKVVAYITWEDRLLLFRQPDAPEAGVQVPAGTVEEGEDAREAVLREAHEETGLSDLQIVSYLGQKDATFQNAQGGQETVRRHYFHLRFSGDAPERWQHWETTPSGDVPGPILFELWWASLAEADALPNSWLTALLARVRVQTREEP